MKRFTADFETTTWEHAKTRVWAWAICSIENENIDIGDNIDRFMERCKNEKNAVFYFHNLKFDGEFIIYWLLINNFEFVRNKKDIKDLSFTTLINDVGQFFQIVVYFKVTKTYAVKATFLDSYKILPFSVEEIPRYFGLKIKKLNLDYNKIRDKDYQLSINDKEYISNDVLIVAKALKIVFDNGKIRMTQSSMAIADYQDMISWSKFNHFFPKLVYEIDKDIRRAYRGSFCYLNPLYEGKEVGEGTAIDVNSLFAYCQKNYKMPYGDPLFFEGKYEKDIVYDMYIQMITCSFELKKNKIPMAQIKDSMYFLPTQYIETTEENIVCLILTDVELKLFFEQYKVKDLKYECGWKFKGINGLFDEYIDYWFEKKKQATIEENAGLRTIAKLRLCSLYGKFAMSMENKVKMPYLNKKGIVEYGVSDLEIINGIYIPVALFITAYARDFIIRACQTVRDYSIEKYGKDLFYYTDTDSIHSGLTLDELKEILPIDQFELGFFKCEGIFLKARFIKQKCYIEKMIDDKIKVVCAGLPKDTFSTIEWNDFKIGFSTDKKLIYRHVKGGVKLVKTNFTIKESESRFYLYNF